MTEPEAVTEYIAIIDGRKVVFEVTVKGERVLDLVRAGVAVRDAVAFVDAEDRAQLRGAISAVA